MAGVTGRAPTGFTLRPHMVGTLFWLRWKLLLRGYSRSVGRIIGAVMLLLFLIPSVGGAAFGLVVAFRFLLSDDAAAALNLLLLILAGLYLLYAILPLTQFYINEGLDVTKLTTYPLTQPELMAGLLIATLLDIPTIGVLLLFVGIDLGWALNPLQGVLIGAVLLLAYIHLVAISQLLLSSLMGLLRTRRFRDLTLVLVTALGLSCSLASQVFSRGLARNNPDALVAFAHQDFASWLQYLPPGMATRAIVAITNADLPTAGLWLVILALSAALVLWAWSAVLARSLATPEEAGSGSKPRRRNRAGVATGTAATLAPAVGTENPTRSLIPAPVLAIATKDLRYYWREPQFKRVFLSALYIVGILLIPVFTNNSQATAGRGTPQYVFAAAILLVLTLTSSMFGYEGAAVATLGLFPVRGIYVFLGKNLAALLLATTEMVVLLLIQTTISRQFANLPILLPAGLGGLLAAAGVGNLTAVLLPMRSARFSQGKPQTDSGTGFITGLLLFGSFFVALLLILPIAAAVVIPPLAGRSDLLLATIPAALVYGIGVYAGGTAIAAGQYYPRLPKIIEIVAQE